jgi:carbon monoxide dehydrogenase subunit G
MNLTNEFFVQAPIDRVWDLLDELENVIPCMPGASYIGRDGEDNKVGIKVKVGAISANFQGSMRFLEKSVSTHTAVIHGVGKDIGGKASAVANIVARLESLSPERTRVVVETDLAMTGRLAQFGGGVIADISSRLISQFTENLHKAIIAQPVVLKSAETASVINGDDSGRGTNTNPVDAHEALDLGSVMGPIVAKYALKYVVVPVVFFVLGWLTGRFS